MMAHGLRPHPRTHRRLKDSKVAVVSFALAACTSTTGSSTSTVLTTVSTTIGLPCVTASGDVVANTTVTVEAGDREVAATLGWLSAAPCSDDGAAVVSDGFFAGLEGAVVTMEDGDVLWVHAPGFDQAQFEASWSGADGSESSVDASKVEPGVWEISSLPPVSGSHTLNLRFEYGADLDAAYAVTVELGYLENPDSSSRSATPSSVPGESTAPCRIFDS